MCSIFLRFEKRSPSAAFRSAYYIRLDGTGGTNRTSPGDFWEVDDFHKLSVEKKIEDQTKIDLIRDKYKIMYQNPPRWFKGSYTLGPEFM